VSRTRSSGPLTVAELVRFGPLSRARSFATGHLDRPVSGVSLISELEKARQCEPNTALVVHPAAAHGIWALESALRFAWERNASCLVAPADIAITGSTQQLAERLRMPLFTVDDPAKQALELAAAIADTEAARARLTARCAVLFGERGSLRDIVGVINTEVPGVIAALVAEDGHVLAGRSAVGRANGDAYRLQVPVPGPDGKPWATLVAQLAAWSPSWVETVETILRLARAPLAASIAGLRLSLAHQASRDRLLLETLLSGETPTLAPPGGEADEGAAPYPSGTGDGPERIAREAGWRIDGTHVAVFLRPAQRERCDFEAATAGVVAAWQEAFPHSPIIPLDQGWVTWFTNQSAGLDEVAEQVRRRLISTRIPLSLTAGIGQVGEGMAGLRRSVTEASLAAAVASRLGRGAIEQYAELGPRAVLACLPVTEIADAARILLADLIADPKADLLITTLTAFLDCAGSTGQAAARLGLHRNTMLGRIERIRSRGVDLEAPEHRLALHVACYALMSTRHPDE
jgi:PucR C-terminal helix-turn-helix domain/GGDEF-like domain